LRGSAELASHRRDHHVDRVVVGGVDLPSALNFLEVFAELVHDLLRALDTARLAQTTWPSAIAPPDSFELGRADAVTAHELGADAERFIW
jgi:hypothetical protein